MKTGKIVFVEFDVKVRINILTLEPELLRLRLANNSHSKELFRVGCADAGSASICVRKMRFLPQHILVSLPTKCLANNLPRLRSWLAEYTALQSLILANMTSDGSHKRK